MGFSPYPRNYSLLFFIHSSSFSIAELENKTSRFNVSSADIGFTHKFSMIFFTWFLALKKEAFIWIKTFIIQTIYFLINILSIKLNFTICSCKTATWSETIFYIQSYLLYRLKNPIHMTYAELQMLSSNTKNITSSSKLTTN